jgi:proteic killer suppression protein
MIRSFKDKRAERLFEGGRVAEFQGFARQAEKRLRLLDAADNLHALRMLPSNRFEALKGDRAGQYSIRINRQWRICFEWRDDDAHDVEIVDYH